MVLGSFDKKLSYPKSLYDSGTPYGFAYVPKSLWLETVAHYDDANNKWLASLFGLSHERRMPGKMTDPEKTWKEYLERIWGYLEQGSPVQIIKGWEAKFDRGQVTNVGTGIRTYWWEGSVWTPSHYFTVVGMDKSEHAVYINDAVLGWFGAGKYFRLDLDTLRKMTDPLPPHLRYVTISFKKTGSPRDEKQIGALVKERNMKKLKGDPSVYDAVEMWREHYETEKFPGFEHGLKALKAFRNDLEPAEFKAIIKRHAEAKRKPLVIISWMDISLNHMAAATGVAAEYLEESGNMKEWEWLFTHHMFFEKLRTSSAKFRSIFKSTEDIDRAVVTSTPILREMRETMDEMIRHVEAYLRAA